MDITLQYEATPEEVARALHLGLRRQLRILYVALWSVLAVAGTVCFLVGSVIMGAGMLVAAVAGPMAATWAVRRIARKQLDYLCVPTTLRVTDDGYETRTDQSTTMMKWSMFSRVEATPEFWLLFVNRQIAAFLPRSAFDGAQRAELDGFLAARENTKAA